MTPTAGDFEQRYRELCDFVSIVAHDLRTPLTSIRGFAQLLQRQARAQADESLRASLDMIVQQAGFGRLMVEDGGPPLAAGERARLFERLVLTTDEGRHRMLAHVGLVIAAGMAAAHGGRLEVESPLPGSAGGARLSLSLPQAR